MRITAVMLLLCVFSLAEATELKCPQLDVTGFPDIRSYVYVLDDQGDAVVGLNRDNFQVSEDDVPISDFTLTATYQGSEFLSAVLAIDISGSMKGDPWTNTQEAVRDFMGRMSASDRFTLLTFNQRVTTLASFMSPRDQWKAAFDALTPKGDTALHDAVLATVSTYEGFSASRRAIILLTDGRDTSSSADANQALAQVKSAGIPIYAIGLGNEVNVQLLTQYADASGGSYFPAATPADLLRIYRQIAGRLQNQYRIDYRTKMPLADSWHTLGVTAKYDGLEVFASRPFLANPRPLVHGIAPFRSPMLSPWIPGVIGAALGLFLALALAVTFRMLEIGGITHRVITICVGLVLGLCLGAIYGFWLM